MSNVKLIKLTTGEEVICSVVEETSFKLSITDAVVVFPAGNSDGGMSLQFAPWTLTMFSETETADVNKSGILAECTVNQEILERYNAMFGNVTIAVPDQKIILS